MSLRRRLATATPVAACVTALAVLVWATSLPFMGVPAWWGDGLQSNGTQDMAVVTWSLAGGTAAQLVIASLAVLAVAIGAYLIGIRRRLTSFICLVASVGSLLVAVFEIGDGGRRILPSWTFPPAGSPREAVTIASGFYVFRDAAAAAVIASLIMLVTNMWGGALADRHVRQPGSRPVPT
jgi:hypothetical protein